MESLLSIVCRKQIRDTDLHGAMIFFNTVMAGCTGDHTMAVKYCRHFLQSILFRFR